MSGHPEHEAYLLQDGLVADLRQVRALDLGEDAVQLFSERVLGRGIQHLLLDLGGVRGPDAGVTGGRWRVSRMRDV